MLDADALQLWIHIGTTSNHTLETKQTDARTNSDTTDSSLTSKRQIALPVAARIKQLIVSVGHLRPARRAKEKPKEKKTSPP